MMKYFVLLLLLPLTTQVFARQINVGTNQTCLTLREALKNAKAGDTIFVHEGTYSEGNLVIDKPLTLIGIN